MNKTIIYLGLKDKDTKNQRIKTSAAIGILSELTLPMTIVKGKGLWQGQRENTLVLTLFNDESLVYAKALCQAIGKRFNQYSVFLEYYNFNDEPFISEVVIRYNNN